MLDQIPTEVTNHSIARTDGVSSSDMLGIPQVGISPQGVRFLVFGRGTRVGKREEPEQGALGIAQIEGLAVGAVWREPADGQWSVDEPPEDGQGGIP